MITNEIDTYLLQGGRRLIADNITRQIAQTENERSTGYVISMRNTGWGDCLLSMVSAWYLAKITHKTLVIDWRHSVYLADSKENAFSRFFQPMTSIGNVPVICDNSLRSIRDTGPMFCKIWSRISGADELQTYPNAVFMDDLTADGASNDFGQSTAVFEGCLCWAIDYKLLMQHVLNNIKLSLPINQVLESFYQKNFKSKMIGVHVRFGNGGNIMNHARYWQDESSALKKLCIAIDLAREKLGADCGIFLSTDTKRLQQKLRRIYPQIISRNKKFRENNAGELHYMKFGNQESEEQVAKMGEDALIDMVLLAKCEVLVRFPPNSYFSLFASAFKQYRLVFTESDRMPVIEY